jgi:hypothetical protein
MEREVADVDLSIPLATCGEDNTVDEARSSSSPTGPSNGPTSQRGAAGESELPGVGVAVARAGLGETSAITRPGCSVTIDCMVVGGPSTAGNVGDAETTVAKGEVEADGVPGILASFPPGEIDAAASTTVEDETAATPDDETLVALGEEGRTAVPGGTT